MFARKSIPVLAVLAVLIAAPLAHAATPATPAASHEVKAPEGTKAPATKHSVMQKLDLNSATREELAKIPGVGETLADKIIAARPITTKSELVSKGIVTKAEFGKLATHVYAKPPVKAEAKPAGKSATKPASVAAPKSTN